jgi:hypothetical protein
MLQAGRRNGRLFCLALLSLLAAVPVVGQGPALTTVSDTVFRADGGLASGTLLISWPAFTTADGNTVAAGNKSVACAGNGLSGTLQFTTLNPHPAGYTVGSASSGLQEALIGARFTPTNPTGASQSGKVIVPPGEVKAFARISIRASNITVDFSGSVVECWMNDTCIFVGDPGNSNLFQDITLVNPRGRAKILNGQAPFIEVNAQKTRLLNVATRLPFSGGTFGSFVQVDDDQSFLLDGLDTAIGGGLRCDSTVCSPAVYAPGPFNTFSAVGWLKHLNISLQCVGNGVDWESGNPY